MCGASTGDESVCDVNVEHVGGYFMVCYSALEAAKAAQVNQHSDALHLSVSSKARVGEDFADLTSGIQLIQASITKWQRDMAEDHVSSSNTSKVRTHGLTPCVLLQTRTTQSHVSVQDLRGCPPLRCGC